MGIIAGDKSKFLLQVLVLLFCFLLITNSETMEDLIKNCAQHKAYIYFLLFLLLNNTWAVTVRIFL